MLSSLQGTIAVLHGDRASSSGPLSQASGAAHASHVTTDGLHSRVLDPGLGSELKSESEGNPFLLRTPISGPWAVSKKGGKIELAAEADDSRVS